MPKYEILNKALVIDPSGELVDFLRFCAGRFWPGLEIVSHLWERGCPDENFDWAGFDLVVMEHRPRQPHEQGIAWLEAIRRHPAAPAVVLISSELNERSRMEAKRLGADAVLNKNNLSPNRFADCLDQVFGGLAPDSDSVLPDVAFANGNMTLPRGVCLVA
jgi:DNA-binding NarL/FixJ family response regulator